MPIEIIWLRLCKEYHCLPSQLDNEPVENINMMLTLPEIEEEETANHNLQTELQNQLKQNNDEQ